MTELLIFLVSAINLLFVFSINKLYKVMQHEKKRDLIDLDPFETEIHKEYFVKVNDEVIKVRCVQSDDCVDCICKGEQFCGDIDFNCNNRKDKKMVKLVKI